MDIKVNEYNAATGETTERDMTPEEIAAMQEMENLPEPVPQSLTSRQLRLQWVIDGHDLATIQAAINQLPEPQKSVAQINWEYAGTFDRDNELLCGVADALGIKDEQLDDIFRDGSRL